MPDPLVRTTARDGVLRLMLNRSQRRNALTREMLVELMAKIDEAAATAEPRCLILAAAGPVFCAGMDLTEMQETASRADAREVWQSDTELYQDVVSRLLGPGPMAP